MKTKKSENKKNIVFITALLFAAGIILLFFTNQNLFQKTMQNFIKMAVQIAPVLLVIFLLMFLNFWLINPQKVKKYLGERSGFKGYFFAILSGIISVGSIYIWYPLLRDLRKNGMSDKLIAVFIYNRSIKLQFLPLMIFYFGLKFSIVLSVLTVVFSLIVGFFVHYFEKTSAETAESK
jgi:uncharacterized membrane protein YraQ (UPF0718 family)